MVIVGDILYSRVARSNLWGLTKMGAEVTLCAPPTLIPQDMLDGFSNVGGHPFASVKIEGDVEKALEGADVVYALRLQLERQRAGHLPSLREYSRTFGINTERLKLANSDALVMHPGPMNEGVEIDPEVAHGTRSVIEEQVTKRCRHSHGAAVRRRNCPVREQLARSAGARRNDDPLSAGMSWKVGCPTRPHSRGHD